MASKCSSDELKEENESSTNDEWPLEDSQEDGDVELRFQQKFAPF